MISDFSSTEDSCASMTARTGSSKLKLSGSADLFLRWLCSSPSGWVAFELDASSPLGKTTVSLR